MKKIFQTGLAFGNENGVCELCNLNYSWLFNTPSNLLWVDKIVVTKPIWDIISGKGDASEDKNANDQGVIIHKSAKLAYEILNSVGLVEIVDSNEIGKEESDIIFNQIEEDLELLQRQGVINRKDSHLYYIGENGYCQPALWTLYASLLYSRKNNCNFSLEEQELFYLRQLLRYKMNREVSVGRKASAVNEVLEMYLPEVRIWPDYIFSDKDRCETCRNMIKCNDSYLVHIEKRLFKLLQDREHDEILEFCQILDKICDEKFKEAYEISPQDLIKELNIEKVKIQQRIKNVYAKVGKWSKIITTISAGLSLGTIFGHPELTAIGGVGVFASQTVDKINDYYKSKYNWVNFVNKHND